MSYPRVSILVDSEEVGILGALTKAEMGGSGEFGKLDSQVRLHNLQAQCKMKMWVLYC